MPVSAGHGLQRVVVFGGAGAIGHRLSIEAATRGHHVTVVTRSSGPLPHRACARIQGDMAEPIVVEHLARQADVVVCAVGPDTSGGGARPFRRVMETVIDHLVGTRLIVIGCAGTLLRPDGRAINGHRHTRDHAEVLQDLHLAPAYVNWTCLTPPPVLTAHPRTGQYLTGTHTPAGLSVSIADLAVALVDEIELPAHPRARFTVAAHPRTNTPTGAAHRGITPRLAPGPAPVKSDPTE
ncbi:NAD(P)-dependent oxidoreductase [Dietzia lutea]|uniref:NAD(P)-binding domain-containing protein n=2 Tax=Dietzia lutea TaxID=546160 RepID=A0A2S1R3T7_9ACTN|nr:NAD(P)H-binding protein [Dietzia lutea]AWH90959.1 hypothetical protein A6035_00800 [Dietzia lutea]